MKQTEDVPYLAIAQALADDIAAGKLKAGDRLPTHRRMAREINVATGTVTRAYAEAERRGLIRGEVGRGTFVCGRPDEGLALPVSSEPDPGLIDLSLNLPLYHLDPDLRPVLLELAGSANLAALLHYQSHGGSLRNRQAGAEWFRVAGVQVDPEDVLIVSGAQHAICVTVSALCKPGDVVLTEALTYPGMRAVANLLHVRLQGVTLDEYGMVPDALRTACRHRRARALYMMPTIQNPTTSILSEQRRQEIVEIAAEFDLAIIEDDVHHPLVPDAPPAIRTMAPDRTYCINSLSKAVSGGLRCGYIAAPRGSLQPLINSIWATQFMAPPLVAEVATRWIEDGTANQTLLRKRKETIFRQQLAATLLRGMHYVTQPTSFHLWLELPGAWGSAEFAIDARRRGVAVTPADAFLVGSESPPRHVRVCLGAVTGRDVLASGLGTLATILSGSPGLCTAVV